MNVYASCACSALRHQKRAMDPLELVLEMVVSHVGARDRTQLLWKSGQ